MNNDEVDAVATEIADLFTEMFDEHEYLTIIAGTALAIAGLALDIPPDAEMTDDENQALQRLFDDVSRPLKAVIDARIADDAANDAAIMVHGQTGTA